MSYILDALRRADSERERGAVPGIHAQPVPVPSTDDAVRRGPRPWVWIVVGLSLGLLLPLGGWWLLGRDTPPPAVAAAPVPPPPIPARPERTLPDTGPNTPAPPTTAVAPPPVAALPAPIERRPTTSEAERKAAAPAAASAAASGPAAAGRAVGRHELPEDIRRQLPQITVSGSMYSSDPASRFLVINGQVVHEKAELGPDHVLVQIKLRAAVLRFKNHLYEITY
jgi:general secretion pathway protein B